MKRIKWNMELMYDYCKEHNYDLPKDNQEYTKTKDNYVYICNKHGEYKQTWQNHKEGKGCRECGLERVKIKNAKTDKCYLQECKQKGLDLPIEPYVNNIKKIRHKCSKGHIYEQTPRDHLRGSGCPYCSGQAKRVDKEYYLVQCKERGYDLPIEKYINSKTPINHQNAKGIIRERLEIIMTNVKIKVMIFLLNTLLMLRHLLNINVLKVMYINKDPVFIYKDKVVLNVGELVIITIIIFG